MKREFSKDFKARVAIDRADNQMDIERYAKLQLPVKVASLPALLLKYLNYEDWSTYIDLGCGNGWILELLNSKGHFAGKKIYAIDLSKTRLERVQKISKDLICIQCDVCDIGMIETGSIDFLTSTQVIEHVRDDGAMVREISRVLKRGKVAFVSTIFKKWYGWYFYRCNGKWVLDPTHLREYSNDDTLIDLFKANGLEIIENIKVPLKYSVSNMLAQKILLLNKLLPKVSLFNNLTIPIPGYLHWEIVCRKR